MTCALDGGSLPLWAKAEWSCVPEVAKSQGDGKRTDGLEDACFCELWSERKFMHAQPPTPENTLLEVGQSIKDGGVSNFYDRGGGAPFLGEVSLYFLSGYEQSKIYRCVDWTAPQPPPPQLKYSEGLPPSHVSPVGIFFTSKFFTLPPFLKILEPTSPPTQELQSEKVCLDPSLTHGGAHLGRHGLTITFHNRIELQELRSAYHAVGNYYLKYSWECLMQKIVHNIFLYCGQPEYFR